MKHSNCLSEQDLTLLHYGEAPADLTLSAAQRHVATCADCRARRHRLALDLDNLPALEANLAPHLPSRLAARVVERLPRRRPLLPVLATALSAVVIVLAVSSWHPQPRFAPEATVQTPAAIDPAAVPDIDLLENLDLLRELDTLTEIVGV